MIYQIMSNCQIQYPNECSVHLSVRLLRIGFVEFCEESGSLILIVREGVT